MKNDETHKAEKDLKISLGNALHVAEVLSYNGHRVGAPPHISEAINEIYDKYALLKCQKEFNCFHESIKIARAEWLVGYLYDPNRI